MFDRLDEVRVMAKARAVEDFEYFSNTVLALSLQPELCVSVQRAIEQNVLFEPVGSNRLLLAVQAWMVVIGRSTDQSHLGGLSATFHWLFGSELRAAA